MTSFRYLVAFPICICLMAWWVSWAFLKWHEDLDLLMYVIWWRVYCFLWSDFSVTFYLWDSIILINVVLGHFFSLWYIVSYWWTRVFAFAYVKIYNNQLSFFIRGTSLIPIPCSQMSIESRVSNLSEILGKTISYFPLYLSHPHPKT